MRTHTVHGVSNNLLPGNKGPICTSQIMIMDGSGECDLDIDSGNGSRMYAGEEFQTIFVDNSLSAVATMIEAFGTHQRFRVPAYSQGYFPLAYTRGASGFKVRSAAGSQIPVTLFNIQLPAAVWSLGTSGDGSVWSDATVWNDSETWID